MEIFCWLYDTNPAYCGLAWPDVGYCSTSPLTLTTRYNSPRKQTICIQFLHALRFETNLSNLRLSQRDNGRKFMTKLNTRRREGRSEEALLPRERPLGASTPLSDDLALTFPFRNNCLDNAIWDPVKARGLHYQICFHKVAGLENVLLSSLHPNQCSR